MSVTRTDINMHANTILKYNEKYFNIEKGKKIENRVAYVSIN